MNAAESATAGSFTRLGLSAPVLKALEAIGYESPSPIQEATIPALLAGRDVLGQAQTGTGKTAAFALPILSKLDVRAGAPQVLVMVPTRELAIQVAEAFKKYAAEMPGFHVVPIYGGQSYVPQLAALKRGTHVVVGTPGRIIDHLDRGTLQLTGVRFVVLDEADEMLAMGFVDAIESILARAPAERQVALFSATMAPQIKRIAQHHLRQPEEINIRGKTTTAANTRQRYWMVSGLHKLDALTRILEVEPFDAMLVFARTKIATVEVADKLAARGFSAAALNGDMQQNERERMIAQLKSGQIDILVATDVAARGLDVERISHVINFDVPYDTESYVHRIGRTGRAGRSGEAILFVAPRERNMLQLIERATRQPIELMHLPTVADVNAKRVGKFKQRVADLIAQGVPENYRQIVEEIVQQTGVDITGVAAALAVAAQGKTPLLLGEKRAGAEAEHAAPAGRAARGHDSGHERHHDGGDRPAQAERPARGGRFGPQEHYRIEVGSQHGVQPGNIVGAIANEAGLSGQEINGLKIREDHSVVRLPAGMPAEVLQRLAKTKIRGRAMAISLIGGGPPKVHRKGGPGKGGFKKKPPRD
jgi:ATP-dependent RNA helicase DeaD